MIVAYRSAILARRSLPNFWHFVGWLRMNQQKIIKANPGLLQYLSANKNTNRPKNDISIHSCFNWMTNHIITWKTVVSPKHPLNIFFFVFPVGSSNENSPRLGLWKAIWNAKWRIGHVRQVSGHSIPFMPVGHPKWWEEGSGNTEFFPQQKCREDDCNLQKNYATMSLDAKRQNLKPSNLSRKQNLPKEDLPGRKRKN